MQKSDSLGEEMKAVLREVREVTGRKLTAVAPAMTSTVRMRRKVREKVRVRVWQQALHLSSLRAYL